MIKATTKPLEEIRSMVAPYRRVLTIGCGGCVSLCLAGGQKEARSLNIKLHASQALGSDVIFDDVTIERQCEQQFLAALDDRAAAMMPLFHWPAVLACSFWLSAFRTYRFSRA